MYLSVNQCDQLDSIVKSFEVAYRSYIANKIISQLKTEILFENAINDMDSKIQSSSVILSGKMSSLLGTIKKNISSFYANLKYANDCYKAQQELKSKHEIPFLSEIVGLSYIFATSYFNDLFVFKTKEEFLFLSSIFYNIRNALSHRGSELISEEDMLNVLYFISEINCIIDERFYWYKRKNEIDYQCNLLLAPKSEYCININNIREINFSNKKFVCRQNKINELKNMVYGVKGYFKKPTTICIYGYGGVGKTALVQEFIKLLVKDIKDKTTINNYKPSFLLFFTAKNEKLDFDKNSGTVEIVPLKKQFDSFKTLKENIFSLLSIDSFSDFNKEGLIFIDNLETIDQEERLLILDFIKHKSPPIIQYVITSRKLENVDDSIHIKEFDEHEGLNFIQEYITENELSVNITQEQQKRLLDLSRGNALVLVLSLNRLDLNLTSYNSMVNEFYPKKSFTKIEKELSSVPPTALEVVSDFMYRNTIQEIEEIYVEEKELIFKVLKTLAVFNDAIDAYTLCIMTNQDFINLDKVMTILCKYMIVERNSDTYSINEFANKYILAKFLPNSIEKDKLYKEVDTQVRNIRKELKELDARAQNNSELAKILQDWCADNHSEKIAISKAFTLFYDMDWQTKNHSKAIIINSIDDCFKKFDEIELVTIHPYSYFQKAKVLSLLKGKGFIKNEYDKVVIDSYEKCIQNIRWYYKHIKSTRSFASALWFYGTFLLETGNFEQSTRYLEDAIDVYNSISINDNDYYQCLMRLGFSYIGQYKLTNEVTYLKMASDVSHKLKLDRNYYDIKYRKYSIELALEIEKHKN